MQVGFSTREFAFSDGMLNVYRKAKVEQIPFDQIIMIELKKGSDLKRPKLGITFGVVLILVCIDILSTYNFDVGEFFASGAILRILSVLFFIGGIGIYSVYSALPIHPIIEILIKSKIERHSISPIIKRGSMQAFSGFLQDEFKAKFKNSLG
jgi:hypothetical protein